MENNNQQTWPDIVHQAMPQFERISRQNNLVVWQEESQFAIQSIQKNSLLAKCTIPSVQNAIINVAAVGLTLNPADQYAYLVPEYNKQLKANECQLRISFKGLVKIATDSGSIKWAKAEIVKANDNFKYKGPCELPEHSMDPFRDRGETVGVYCVAKTNDGDYLTDVMSAAEIAKIRSCAKTQMVWDSWPDEMSKKAIIKRSSKQWPKTQKSSSLHKAIEIVNDVEGSDPFAEMESVAAEILDLIEKNDLLEVGKIWCECSENEQSTLWTAKTKGGWFTTSEKDKIRESCTLYKNSIAEA